MLLGGKKSVLALVALGCSGCSVIYDGDVFARADAAPPIDPAMLGVNAVEPTQVYEGQGVDEDSRPVPVLLRGSNISPGARVVVTGPGIDFETALETSASGTMAAFALRVPVSASLGASDAPADLTLTVFQDSVEDRVELELVPLDELDVGAGPLELSELAPLYSRITIDQDVELIGDAPARFVATDSISVSAAIRADGRGDGERAAGGHLGGAVAMAGGGDGGGGGGSESGGGGGGNREAGAPGQGNAPGSPGPASRATLLSPLTQVTGAGGGGGGAGATAGAGGDGGGAVEFRAGGTLAVLAGAALSANGQTGADAGTLCSAGGAGGGGAGGAFLLRSGAQVTFEGSISVTGGDGGTGGTGGLGCDGGMGSAGQVRIDTPRLEGTVAGSRRGPAWLPDSVPPIVAQRELQATLIGAVGETYFVELNDEEVATVAASGANETVPVSLTPGKNELCAQVLASANPGQPESFNCVSIIYLAQ